jgi:hypothetical protein
MLKIKDNVDLKELEKFGFKKTKEYAYGYYFKDIDDYFRIAICKPIYEHKDREIFIDTIGDLDDVIDDYNNVIFDLIQAGLVEKVVEE